MQFVFENQVSGVCLSLDKNIQLHLIHCNLRASLNIFTDRYFDLSCFQSQKF